jgi:hypothetical protein
VDEHISVGVAQGTVGVWHLNAPQPEGEALLELMDVVAKAGTNFHGSKK